VPDLIDALRAANIEVDEVNEEHPSFDDVFVQLMDAEAADAADAMGEGRAQRHR
jgi:hypothetical protein